MGEIRSRADVVADRLAAWKPELDAIEQAEADQAAADAELRETLDALDEIRERAMARFAQIENCAALGVDVPEDQEGDDAIRVLAEMGDVFGGDEDDDSQP